MYCRIYEPGKQIVNYGQKFTEFYFITKGTVSLYEKNGVYPFLLLPTYSYFGVYQIMFDLRANYIVKIGGKEEFEQKATKADRTFFLCVDQEVFRELLDQFPKSKFLVQKRGLQRRKVFMDQLEKLE
jgi:signal-transduction protein with cAMP-binding, CBS, and nucleotidyltransferase domain